VVVFDVSRTPLHEVNGCWLEKTKGECALFRERRSPSQQLWASPQE
jgi:hypothetical protein